MNNNETSILPHVATMPVITKVNLLAEAILENKGTVYSTANILVDLVAIVCDNAGFEVELRITNEGYSLAFPQDIEADEVLGALDQGLEVLEEMSLED
ncbi:hypothetical protein SEA_BUBBABEAR_37 [Microbacterium phage BubbaBear]|uniref:hypothetical protein n=1 Tax=Microbacterium phage BubbaBear TaxID=2572529 RepID=UPI0010C29EEE|nr:hypothetical protein QDW44_gp37 [Microbacterium phage BubbaBear]YP_010754018.1 hypothetical protein QDW46_gp39 [Microbacterium phage SansAfet]QCG77298.1 hypothetical protein SEA_BUBBABEAR_37 [Microbacterium phage BubbaBear]QFP94294.1 hypothetical protein SEA_SANSAFET_39 [Microbacterium phage SansAfet]